MTARPAHEARSIVMRPVRKPNAEYRVREHLTETEIDKLLAALKGNRHGQRDWLIGLMIYRHGLRVSEACDLRWDDIDLAARTVVIRRLKGSRDSRHYLERDELGGLRRLPRSSAYVFVNERGDPFKREGIARMIQRAGAAANIPFPVHVHMLRHACGYALANKGMDTRRLTGHTSNRPALSNCYGNRNRKDERSPMSLRQGAIASEQAINRLSGYRREFPQNRELTGKYRQEPPSEAIGAIDRSRAQFNEAYLEDLVSWSGRRWGVRRWR